MTQHESLTAAATAAEEPFSLLSELDLHLFSEGTHYRLYEKLGCHTATVNGVAGAYFAVWAPDAAYVSVIGDFNAWDRGRNPLRPRGLSGLWEGFVPGLGRGAIYKYHVASRHHGYQVDKADPFGVASELPPRTGSLVWDLDYEWGDAEWMQRRDARSALAAPQAIYEVHLGSWMRVPEEGERFLTYREVAPLLADYVTRMGFTHVEFLPLMEHPYYASWGYQTTGYFAPTSRYGGPQDLMFLIDYLHQRGIGVILDWVPSHFPSDQHALSYFDGTHAYEHADQRQGFHPDWNSLIFNYGRNEVRAFLISSALFWLSVYHADGLRVDAVASMLYLDYSRRSGEWVPNRYGGRENLEAISLLHQLNRAAYTEHPGVQMIAEESTAWPLVSRPIEIGGLGFGLKWDMGWMHDTLKYMALDSLFRRYQHNLLTFRMLYAFNENFILPLSHDEVVHGKGSLLNKMPGDVWQKCANLRLLFGYMYAQPGKKLLFMGGEFGQWREWNHDTSLDWHLAETPAHAGIQRWVADLNRVYRETPALHRFDCEPGGFEWVEANDADQSVTSFLRSGAPQDPAVLVVCNFTPVPRYNYRVGVPSGGFWSELLNSDAHEFGGSGVGNMGGVEAAPVGAHGRPYSLNLTLPPLGALFLRNTPRSSALSGG
jgi:1,4-alpha-glucan branching enzyme